MFSVVDGVLLRPLPYASSDRLVFLFETLPPQGRSNVAPANFLDWRQQSRTLERVAAFSPMTVTLMTDDGPENVRGSSASADLFPALGISPVIGTGFTAEHEQIGGPSVIVR